MATTREIRRRIRSVRNVAQITRAVQMVASSKMRRAQERVLASRPYSDELIKLLARLDKIKFIELMPGNRIRLLVSKAFAWIPDGPIQRLFKEQFQVDFFRSRFDREGELMLLANGALSRPSVSALLARLRKTMAEFSAMRSDDAALPSSERAPITLLIAARPWLPDFLRRFRRKEAPSTAKEKRARVTA